MSDDGEHLASTDDDEENGDRRQSRHGYVRPDVSPQAQAHKSVFAERFSMAWPSTEQDPHADEGQSMREGSLRSFGPDDCTLASTTGFDKRRSDWLKHDPNDPSASRVTLPDSVKDTSFASDRPRRLKRRDSNADALQQPSQQTKSRRIWSKFVRPYIAWRFWKSYLVALLIIAILIGASVYQKELTDKLTPLAHDFRQIKGGFLIPFALFIVLSFPPLAGMEIVATLTGLVYGIGIGFAITCAGSLIGEFLAFALFRYGFRAKAERFEKRNVTYASIGYIFRRSSGWQRLYLIVLARLGLIPPHYLTALLASVKTPFWVFALGSILSIPRQGALVVLGVVLLKPKSERDTRENWLAVGLTLLFTLLTVISTYVYYLRLREVRPILRQEIKGSPSTSPFADPALNRSTSRPASSAWSDQAQVQQSPFEQLTVPNMETPRGFHSVAAFNLTPLQSPHIARSTTPTAERPRLQPCDSNSTLATAWSLQERPSQDTLSSSKAPVVELPTPLRPHQPAPAHFRDSAGF